MPFLADRSHISGAAGALTQIDNRLSLSRDFNTDAAAGESRILANAPGIGPRTPPESPPENPSGG